ncbi:MAG: cytochrome c [bacterium]|nr:cytochrome c [bacterium]
MYALNCVVCHNDSGEGGTGADLRRSTLALAEITSVIVNGRGKLMPPWGEILTAAEIEAVALYVKSLQKG